MLTFKDGTPIKTPLFASASGCRTSERNVTVHAGGAYVESDWTLRSALILGKTSIVANCTDRAADAIKWTGASALNPKPGKCPKGWESV